MSGFDDPARHRYYGFRHETELFPLWVYEGELAPEFLERESAWRFYDRKPMPYFNRAELPKGLAEELFRLMPSAEGAAKAAPALVPENLGAGTAPSGGGSAVAALPARPPSAGIFGSILAVIKRLIGRA
ncbi:MAG: hypothetical protein EOP11_20295 [Proteobacteria bacterium]|nr:MAG: hypothetical protein EOP11_20295 [Pseudomonadota bacterium]